MRLIIALIKSTAGTKLGSILLDGSAFWPKRSGTTTQPLAALFSAVLLRRMN